MKNLPEKIYLNLNMTPQEVVETKDKDFHDATKTWEITWSEEMLSEHDPEYVRKDSFIGKACEWLKENITNNPNANSVLVRNGCVTLGMLIENFKTYMER